MSDPIISFKDEYAFLSNFYPAKIMYGGIEYPTSEHMYVAMKTLNITEREHIATIETPGQVKRFGRTLTLRKDWNKIKLKMMYICVSAKFDQNIDLIDKLLATGDAELIEGNNWNDTYWGVCNGIGENHLGKVLMNTRWEYYIMSIPVK